MSASSGDKHVVTGGAGFIGSHLCEELLKRDKDVVSIDNYVYDTRENITQFLDNPHFRAKNADITDGYEMLKEVNNAKVVYNLAASKFTYCMDDPFVDMEVKCR